MHSLSKQREWLLASLLAIYCAYYLISSLYAAWGFTTDDAYISWFYARQLVNGNGLLWHTTLPPVEGYSNFLWIVISALVIKLKLPVVVTMKFISCFSLGIGLIFLFCLSRLFFSPLLAMLPVILYSHYKGVVWWTVSGLETSFYTALVILLIWQCMKALGYHSVKPHFYSTKAWVITNVALLLVSLTRFEGPIWIIPIGVFVLCQMRTGALKKNFYGWGLITLFCFVIPYAIYFIWRLNYFGHWVPNSYSCKGMAPGQLFEVDFEYLFLIPPLIFASLPYFLEKKDCRHWLLWLPSLLYVLMLLKAAPIITYNLRLFLAPFALLSLLPVLGINQFLLLINFSRFNSKIMTTMLIILLTWLFIPGNDNHYVQKSVTHYQERTHYRNIITHLLNTQATKGDTVLLGDCGLIPFQTRSDIKFIDYKCLNNAELTQAPYCVNLNRYVNYLQKQVKPDWVVIDYNPQSHRGYYWYDILREKHFFKDYKLISILEGVSNDYAYKIYKRR